MNDLCGQDLDALVFGELDEAAAARVRTHLRGCERCQREQARLTLERRLFGSRPSVATTPALPSFERVMARAIETRRPLRERVAEMGSSLFGLSSGAPFAQAVVGGAMVLVVTGMLRLPAPAVVDETSASRPVAAGEATAEARTFGGNALAVGRLEGCDERLTVCVEGEVLPVAEIELAGGCAQSVPDDLSCLVVAQAPRDFPRQVEYESRVDPMASLGCGEGEGVAGMSIPEPSGS